MTTALAPGLARKVKKVASPHPPPPPPPSHSHPARSERLPISDVHSCLTAYLAVYTHTLMRQVFDTRTESPEILGSLGTLSAFYADNTAAERRRLRATIERQGRQINEQYLAAAEEVTQASIE